FVSFYAVKGVLCAFSNACITLYSQAVRGKAGLNIGCGNYGKYSHEEMVARYRLKNSGLIARTSTSFSRNISNLCQTTSKTVSKSCFPAKLSSKKPSATWAKCWSATAKPIPAN